MPCPIKVPCRIVDCRYGAVYREDEPGASEMPGDKKVLKKKKMNDWEDIFPVAQETIERELPTAKAGTIWARQ